MIPNADLLGLLDTLGIDIESNAVDSDTTLHILMNTALQCLGGIKQIVAHRVNKCQAINVQLIRYNDTNRCTDDAFLSIRKTFAIAVKRMIRLIVLGAENHDLDPSKHLIESFPDRNKLGKRKWLPLQWAVVGDELFEEGRAISVSTEKTTLNERIEYITKISRAFPDTILEKDREGRSYIHYACRLESTELIDAAVESAKPHDGFAFVNNNGALPFHNAARYSKSLKAIQHLLKIYPQPLSKGNNENTLPIHWAAAKSTNPKIVEELIKAYPESIKRPNNEGYLPLHCSGQNTCLEVVQTILNAYPAGISVLDQEGGYPLHHACCINSSVDVIRCMYEAYPAAMSIPQDSGNLLPIHLAAAQNQCPDVLKFILNACPGAASAKDNDGFSPLHCLLDREASNITRGRLECLRILLKANFSAVHERDTVHHNSPLDICVRKNFGPLVIRLLLNACPSGLTPEYMKLYRDYNWESRKLTLMAILNHRESVLRGVMAMENSSYIRTITLICQKYEHANTKALGSEILKHVIQYL